MAHTCGQMKMKVEHLVPLSTQAVGILRTLHPITGDGQYVFPSLRSKACMSENTINAALRYMGYSKEVMTGHGFRAMARTILDEVLGERPDLIEHKLAHTVRDPLGRAYNRTSHLPARREMMQRWADYLDKLRVGAEVCHSVAADDSRRYGERSRPALLTGSVWLPCEDKTQGRFQKRSGDVAAGVNAALLPLRDFSRIPGHRLRPDRDWRWQNPCLHFPPDSGARPAGGFDHRRQAQEFSGRVHNVLLHSCAVMGMGSCAGCVRSPWRFDEGGSVFAPTARAAGANRANLLKSLLWRGSARLDCAAAPDVRTI